MDKLDKIKVCGRPVLTSVRSNDQTSGSVGWKLRDVGVAEEAGMMVALFWRCWVFPFFTGSGGGEEGWGVGGWWVFFVKKLMRFLVR